MTLVFCFLALSTLFGEVRQARNNFYIDLVRGFNNHVLIV